jgi:hypothetical protein
MDAGIGALLPEAIAVLQQRGALLVRFNMWPAIAGSLVAAHEAQRICKESMGWATLAGIPVVAGGAMGRNGDVIVDSVREPSRVIGVADGQGGTRFHYTSQEADRVRRVTEEIHSRIVAPHLAPV